MVLSAFSASIMAVASAVNIEEKGGRMPDLMMVSSVVTL